MGILMSGSAAARSLQQSSQTAAFTTDTQAQLQSRPAQLPASMFVAPAPPLPPPPPPPSFPPPPPPPPPPPHPLNIYDFLPFFGRTTGPDAIGATLLPGTGSAAAEAQRTVEAAVEDDRAAARANAAASVSPQTQSPHRVQPVAQPGVSAVDNSIVVDPLPPAPPPVPTPIVQPDFSTVNDSIVVRPLPVMPPLYQPPRPLPPDPILRLTPPKPVAGD